MWGKSPWTIPGDPTELEIILAPTSGNGATLKFTGVGLKPCLRNRVQSVPE